MTILRKWSDQDIEVRFTVIEDDNRLANLEIDGELAWPMIRESLFFHMIRTYSGRGGSNTVLMNSTDGDVLGRQLSTLKKTIRNEMIFQKAFRIAKRPHTRPLCLAVLSFRERQRDQNGLLAHPIWSAIGPHPDRAFDLVTLESEYAPDPIISDGLIVVPADRLILPLPKVVVRFGSPAKNIAHEVFNLLVSRFAEDGNKDFWKEFCLGGRVVRQIIQHLSLKHRALPLLNNLEPDCVALKRPSWSGLIAAARKLNIPVIELQHGFTNRYYVAYHWPTWVGTTTRVLPVPDHLITFSPYWSDELRAGSLWPGARLHSLGSIPIHQAQNEKGAPASKNPDEVSLLYTTGFLDKGEVGFWREVLQQSKGLIPDFKLVVKLHPQSSDSAIQLFQGLCEQFPEAITVYRHSQVRTLDLIRMCTIHCSVMSTCHYEAIAMGKPTVVIKLQGWEFMKNLCMLGAARVCENPHELVDLLNSAARQNKVWDKWCRDTARFSEHFFASGATENIVQFFNTITHQTPDQS